jgi:DNA-binding CsgD family transcriptional regulator
MISQRVLCRSFIGRAIELDHLAMRRRAAGDGHGGAVLVSGEAGIGKSRLIREYCARFGGVSGSIVSSACREFAQRPLGPIADVLAQLDRGARALIDGPAVTRYEQLEALSEAFDAAARRRTTTVVIEDIHWADIELIQTLTFLAERAASRRLLFIATYRDNEITPSSSLFKPFGRLVREPSVSLLRLEPLAGSELAQFVHASLKELDVTLPPATLDDVRRRSGGNPLFAEELLRHAVDEWRAGKATMRSALPISLHAVVRERIDRCDPEQRELLSQASVLGRRFRLDLLGEVFGFAPDDRLQAVRGLRELQLLDARDDDPLGFEFRHALTRDAVYEELPPHEVRRLHARVAETIEARPDAAEHVEVLAHSFWQAGLLDRAAPYCEAAAAAAERVHADDEAAIWYERAATGYGDRGLDAARTLQKAGWAMVRLQVPDEGLAFYKRAADLYAAEDDIAGAVTVTINRGGILFNEARSQEAIATFDAAYALAQRAGLPQLAANVKVRLLSAYAAQRSLNEALRCIAEIDATVLDPRAVPLVEYHLAVSSVHAQLADVEQWRASAERALAVALDIENSSPTTVRHAYGSISLQAANLGEMRAARERAAEGLAVARRIHSNEPYMLTLLGDVEWRAGNIAKALEIVREIPPSGDFLPRRNAAILSMRLALALGDDDLLQSHLDPDLLAQSKSGGNPFAAIELFCTYAAGLSRQGRHDEAAPLLDQAASRLAVPFGFAFEIATIALLRPKRAAHLRTILEPRDGRQTGRVDRALLALVDATLARSEGDEQTARERAATAAEAFSEIGWPWLEAQSREVAEQSNAALEIYRRIGAHGEVRRLERRTLSDPNAARGGVLTPRERELAMLVAAGKDNRAAAEALCVSKKAVEKYLTSIYAKLGLSSRAQLAVYVATHDAARAER